MESPTIAQAYYLKRVSRPWHSEKELKHILIEFLSWGDRVKEIELRVRKPKQLEFIEQNERRELHREPQRFVNGSPGVFKRVLNSMHVQKKVKFKKRIIGKDMPGAYKGPDIVPAPTSQICKKCKRCRK